MRNACGWKLVDGYDLEAGMLVWLMGGWFSIRFASPRGADHPVVTLDTGAEFHVCGTALYAVQLRGTNGK